MESRGSVSHVIKIGIVAVAVCATTSTVLQAQRAAGTADVDRMVTAEVARRVPVMIALVDSTAYPSESAVIFRLPGTKGGDAIVLRRSTASSTLLTAAVLQLLALRDIQGDTASTSSVTRIVESSASRVLAAREARSAESVIARLSKTAPKFVEGIGFASSVDVYLPSKAMRDLGMPGTGRRKD